MAGTTSALLALHRRSTVCEGGAEGNISVKQIVLRDGRKLAFAVESSGNVTDIPVIAIHGMASSHLSWVNNGGPKLKDIAPGFKMIAVDRCVWVPA